MTVRRVLLAEDDETIAFMMGRLLQRKDFQVTIVSDGVDALEAWATTQFGIILMDLQMPRKDGLETTRAIREKETLDGNHIPIVGLTAHAFPEDHKKCLAAGMDDVITKPVDFNILLSVLKKYLGE
ncbi:MAG TPA: response regulator [Desulfuromonadaceae bacterium]|jgi:CheY-like chemotaxis protein